MLVSANLGLFIASTHHEPYGSWPPRFKDVFQRSGYASLPYLGNPTNRFSDSKIDLLDPPDVVTKKIKKAEAAPTVTEGNGLLAFTEFVLLPASSLYGGGEFQVDRERDGLEPLVYKDAAKMHEDYKNDIVCDPAFP